MIPAFYLVNWLIKRCFVLLLCCKIKFPRGRLLRTYWKCKGRFSVHDFWCMQTILCVSGKGYFNSFKFLLCEWNPLMSKVGGQKVMEMLTLKAVCIHQYWISIIKIDPEKKISWRWKLFFQLLSVQHHKQFRVKCCEWSFVEYSGNYFPRQTMGIAECCLDFLVFDWLQAFAPYVTSICRETDSIVGSKAFDFWKAFFVCVLRWSINYTQYKNADVFFPR